MFNLFKPKMHDAAYDRPLSPPSPPETRAVLIDIRREGRIVTFVFERNGQVYSVDTYSSMELNYPTLKKELVE